MRVAAIWTMALLLLVTVPAAMGQGIISTVAGKPWVFTGDGGPATNAPLGGVAGTAVDSSGNLYVADPDNNIVVKITPGGTLTIVAGGPGMTALTYPVAVAVDATGNNVYVAELAHRVSKIGSGGTLTTVAGNGTAGFSGDNGPATSAQLNQPSGLALDTAGNLYISDRNNNRIRKVTPGGVITTYVGNGTAAFGGDNGLATLASLYSPAHVAVDTTGNLFIADFGNCRVRRVDSAGAISTVAGTGSCSYSGDNGPATAAAVNYPAGVAVGAAGAFYIADSSNNRLRNVNGAGVITTIAGSGLYGFSGDGGPATSAALRNPYAVSVGAADYVYIADRSNSRIRRVDTSSTINTFAGNGNFHFDGDGGPATAASLFNPVGVALDSSGNLYIGDYANNRVRKVTTSGIISTLAGNGTGAFAGDSGPATTASLYWPTYVAFDSSSNLYISDYGNNRIRKVTPAGTITTFAGGGTSLGDNGPATLAQVRTPVGMVFDSGGNLYVGELFGNRVRKIDTSGTITTIAGSSAGTSGSSGDDGPATLALLNGPDGLAIDANGNIYIADRWNNRVRKITPGGVISRVAGTGTAGSSGDGSAATLATLNAPAGLALDSAGNLYIGELNGNRVRRVDATTAIITTVGGGGATYPGDGLLATNAQLSGPGGITLDSAGNLCVAEYGGNRIRKITNPGTPAFGLTVSPSSQTVNAGLSTSYTVTITAAAGFTGAVTLSCSGLPAGASCSFAPSAPPPGTAALTVTTTAGTTPAGTWTFTITGTSGAISYSTSAKLTVTTNPDFLISVSPSSQTAAAGLRATYSVTITPMNGFTGAVALSCSSGLPSGASCSFSPNPATATSTLTIGTTISTPTGGFTVTITGTGGGITHAASPMIVVTTAAVPGLLTIVSGNNQSAPSGYALPNPLVVRVADGSNNPITGVAVTFAVTGGGGMIAPTSSITDINGQASAGWVLGASGNTAQASVSGVSPVSFSASVSLNPPPLGPGITTVAGSTWVFPPSAIGGSAMSAPLGYTRAVAVDAFSNTYVADGGNHMVFKISSGGLLSVVAGTGTAGYSGDSGPATAAMLNNPAGLAVDSAGNVYISDFNNNRVRKVSASTGIIATVAGTGTYGYSGDGGLATSAQLNFPTGLTLDTDGNLYIADCSNNRVRKVSTGGIITTAAGNGSGSHGGDAGPATAAQVWNPAGVAFDASGNLYIAEYGGNFTSWVRKVDLGGYISTVPNLSLIQTSAVAIDGAGYLYIADTLMAGILKVLPGGTPATFAGTGTRGFSGDGGPATNAKLYSPTSLAVDLSGNVYIADSNNYRIRKVTGSTINTIGGNGMFRFGGDSGPATSATLSSPSAIVRDTSGNLYVADTNNHRIRKVSAAGTITTIAGTGASGYSGDNGQATAAMLDSPTGLALDQAGNLYIADSYNYRVRKLNLSTGVITTVAGGGSGGDGGPATAANLAFPRALALDAAGNLYIGSYDNRVRKVTADGIISTFAGAGVPGGYSGDGGPATAAMIGSPYGIAVDASGNIYIADGGNNRVRRVDTAGIITTVAGTGACCYSGDGGPATAARIYPFGVAVDSAGNLYIATGVYNRVRRVSPATGGVITTYAGTGTSGFAGDGGYAIQALLSGPWGLWADTNGLYVADSGNYRIRLVSSSVVAPDFTLSASPSSQSLAAGLTASYTVTVAAAGGFTSPVSLSCSGLPAGASCSFSPNPAPPGGATMTVSTLLSTPAGTSTITVTGTGGGFSRSTTAGLTVTAAAVPATLTILSGNNQTGPAGGALPNPLVVRVANGSSNPIAGVTVTFAVTGGGGTIAPASAITDVSGQASAGWVIGSSGNTASASVNGLSPVTFNASVSGAAPFGPGITTVAGSAWSFSGAGGAATSAPFGEVRGVLADSAGNVYVADNSNNMVFKISSTGTLSIVAGTGIGGFSGDAGPATNAQLSGPYGLALDSSSNLYIAESGNQRIRKVNLPSGIITTFAGTGTAGSAGDGGPATAAQLWGPFHIALDASGALYIAERDGHRIRRIAPSGTISTVAGTGVAGYSGDSGLATAAQLNRPRGVVVDPAGNVYIGDSDNGRIRRVDTSGTITTFVSTGSPYDLALDVAGNIYVANGSTIQRVSPSAVVSPFAGTGTSGNSGDGGPATAAQLVWPVGVAVDPTGNVYIADTRSYRVRKVNTAGTISTFGGNGAYRYGGDGGPATSAAMSSPSGVARDASGNLYIADTNNHRIRKVTPGGTISTFAGNGAWSYSGDGGPAIAAGLAYPLAVIADAAGNLYVADRDNCRVRGINAAGVIYTLAGTGMCGYSGDGGAATAAQISNPRAFAFGPDGSLYIAEGDRVRRVSPTGIGIITTVAGTATPGYSGDGGPATAAQLWGPTGVVVDALGNVYIADASNYRVRRVDPAGVITTVAGTGVCCQSGDGGPASAAQIQPYGVALDSVGNLYVAVSNHLVRRVSPAMGGVITTYAGTGVNGFAGDGGYALSAWLSGPQGLWADSSGLYLADTGNHRIRLVSSSVVVPDFTLSVLPSSQSVAAGLSTSYTVSVAAVGGFSSSVALSCSGLPVGASCSFSPNPAVPGNSTLTVSTLLGTPAGTPTLTVTGTSAGLVRSATASLTVAAPAVAASLTIVSGNNQSGPGGSALPNPLVVRVADGSGNPIAGVSLTFAVAAGGGSVSPTAATTAGNGQAQAAWILGTNPGTNTATASSAGLTTVTFAATATQVPAGPGITTIAGSNWIFSGAPASAAALPLGTVQGSAIDTSGNLYVADSGNHMVFKITAAGTLTIVAGNGTAGLSGDGGPATSAQLNYPAGVAVDSAFNVYIADRANYRIRKVSGGIITTVAGSGSPTSACCGYAGDGGPAILGQLWNPTGVAVDTSGNLYIADKDNHSVRKVDTSGTITTVAGNGAYGSTGDGGPATSALLNQPNGVAVDAGGNLYIADSANNRIRKITSGTITTVAGTGSGGSSGDGGPATAARLNYPTGVAFDTGGNMYIADQNNNRVRMVSSAGGAISTLAGNGPRGFAGDAGPASGASLNVPNSVAVDSLGVVYIADTNNYRIRKISAGVITTFGGNGLYRFGGDSGPATSAQLSSPRGIARDSAGNLYIADLYNHRVRKVAAGGTVTTIAGTGVYGYSGDGGPATAAMLAYPSGVAVDSAGNVYIADQDNNRVRVVSPGGTITTFAGSGTCCTLGDGGPATAAWLSGPRQVFLDGAGNLYISDTGNHRIRKVTAGTISTLAGAGTAGYSGDGGAAASAQLSSPTGVSLDSAGNLYIADQGNRAVRKVDSGGTITSLAGAGTWGCSGDGIAANTASLTNVWGVMADSSGNVYFADENCHRVRKVTPSGVMMTVAGTGTGAFGGDGGAAIRAQLWYPQGLWVDSTGNVYIADTTNHRIRLVGNAVSAPDFSLSVTPSSQSVAAGSPAAYTLSIAGTAGFNAPVNLSCTLSVIGSCSVSPNPALPGSATLTVGPLFNAPPGTVTINITGTSGSFTRYASASLTVAAGLVPANLTIVSGNNQSGLAGTRLANSLVVQVTDGTGNPISGVPISFSVTGGGGSLAQTMPLTTANGQAQTSWMLGSWPGANTVTASVGSLSVTFTATGTTAATGPAIITVAGSNWTFTGDGGPATSAPLGPIWKTALDASGNLYAADAGNYRVFKITPGGTLTIVAGNGTSGFSGDNGPATSAQVRPVAVAVDSAGNTYITDQANQRIRKVNTSGIITTVAGTGTAGFSGDGGQATSAMISTANGIAVDSAGNLYIADTNNQRIRKITVSTGMITTVAGSGVSGPSGDGGLAIYAQLRNPNAVAFDSSGNMYIADSSNYRVRKVDTSGTITTVAGNGNCCYSGGVATSAMLNFVNDVAVDATGNIYVAEANNNRLRKVTTAGTITNLVGNGVRGFSGDGGPAITAMLSYPSGVAVDSSGNVYVADQYNSRVRKVTSSGTISTFAGNGQRLQGGDGGPATSAVLFSPAGGVSEPGGNFYILDFGGNRIRKVTSSGTITTFAGTGVFGYGGDGGPATAAMLANPAGLARDAAGNLYVADLGNNRIRKIDTSGTITTIAGNGICCNIGDGGRATDAYLSSPRGILVDATGNIFIADSGNHRIRKIDTAGIIWTVAGAGTAGFSGDGGPATYAQLNSPYAVALDTGGNLYIADRNNYRIRKVDAGGTITTIAGTGGSGCASEGGAALALSFGPVQGLAVDSAGNVLFPDQNCQRVRKLTPAGAISTVAGTGSSGFAGDGGAAISAQLNSPQGLWLDAGGYLFIADTSNNRIREVASGVVVADYTLAITPSSQTVAAGLSTTYTISTTVIGGFTGWADLDCSGLPAGAACKFSPSPVSPGGSSTLTLSTAVTMAPGTATFTVTGAAGGPIRTATASLTVTAAATPASFTIVSGNNQSGPAGSTLPNPLVVRVADGGGDPIAGVTVGFAVSAGGGSVSPASATTAANGQAAAGWTLGSVVGPQTVTATVTGLPSVTFTANGTSPALAGGPLITEFAGTDYVFSGAGGPVLNASLGLIQGMRFNAYGNLFIADTGNHMAFKISPDGIVTVVAGRRSRGFSGDGGLAVAAEVDSPIGIALDAAGNVYIADRYNHRVRKVSTTGVITTVAGSGTTGYSGDGGPATSAQLNYPASVVLDPAGNLYIADTSNNRIRKVTPGGTITTVAGSGVAGYFGDGGLATMARLNGPQELLFDGAGNLYIADVSNNRVRKVDPSGVITTVAGTGTSGFAGDGGQAASAQVSAPAGLALDSSGNLYIADQGNNRVRKINTAGIISTFAGTSRGFSGDGGPATSAALNQPGGVIVDSAGNVLVADTYNYRLRKVDGSGTIVTTGGNGMYRYGGDSGPALGALLQLPAATAVDSAGNVYIVDTSNHRVRKVTPGGTITTFAGIGIQGYSGDGGAATAAKLALPGGVAVDAAGNVYISDRANQRIRKVDATGIITTLAGTGTAGFSGDHGPATAAMLSGPRGLAVTPDGYLVFADTSNNRIRSVDPAGMIRTEVGTGVSGFFGDGGPVGSAQFRSPYAVVIDISGTGGYIADRSNYRIRKVDGATGIVTTVAGNGTNGCSGDGGPATAASISTVSGIGQDAAGNLYIANTGCNRIRMVTAGGIITTVAGTGAAGGAGNGGPAINAELYSPQGVTVDLAGNLIITDTNNNRIRKVWSGGLTPTDFALSVAPGWRAVPTGSAATYTVTVTGMGGFNLPVNLSCSGLPTGASCSFSPNPAVPGTSTLTLSTTLAVPNLLYGFTVTGTSGSLSHGDIASFTVTPPPASLVVVSGNNQSGPAGATLPNPVVVRAIDANGVPAPGAQVTFTATNGALVPAVAATDANGVASAGWTLAPAPGANSGTATTPGLSPVLLAATGATPGPPLGITTVAGSTWNFYGNGGPATNAPLGTPQAATMDSAGNVYVADCDNHRIAKISPAGVLTVVAGSAARDYSGDGGPATAAGLWCPSDIAVDATGNIYIADTTNNRIRRVDAAGTITTVAGNGIAAYSGDNGPATGASLNSPYGIFVDATGKLYIADSNNNRIRMVDTSGNISTIAGGGASLGDSGPATAAGLDFPTRAVLDSAGNLYVADTSNNRIRKVAAGIITTVAGNGIAGFSGDTGPAIGASLSSPWGVAVDTAGNIYIPDSGNNRLRKVDSSGNISTVAGTGASDFTGDNGPVIAATLSYPQSPVVDASGNIYIADTGNERIRKITSAGVISTIAGNGMHKYDGDGGPATQAHLWQARALAFDPSGNLLFADANNNRIRRIDGSGTITTIAGRSPSGYSGDGGPSTVAQFDNIWGLAVDSAGNIYVADRDNRRVRKISATGTVSTVAGTGTGGPLGDGGPATAASLNARSVVVDNAGNLYIGYNARIRKVDAGGTITTVAGVGTSGYTGDGGPATNAQIGLALGLRLDAAGNLYFADNAYGVVRKIDTNGVITTVAGNGTRGYSGDGGPATLAQLYSPRDIVFDASGNLCVSDDGNYTLRKVTPGGVITTVAGTGTQQSLGGADAGDGGLATAALLRTPMGLAMDSSGSIYLGDSDRVRKIWPFTNPVPAVSALTPATVPTGPALTLIVTGSGFSQGSVVRWNGSDRPTTFVSTTQLTAAIPASDLPAAGTAQITVFSPAPGGGLSNAMVLTIVTPNPLPVITSLSPVDRTAGSGGFLLTVNGVGVVTGATVQWAGSPRPTTYVSGSELTAQISDTDAATAGMFLVTVVNPAPGGGTSAGMPFTVHPAGSYLVGDAAPASGNNSGLFGNELLDNMDLILALRAVTSVPGFLPANCSDLFDAMDSYPVDNAARGGDGMLDNLDLIATLRRVTNADTSRPRRATRGLVCSTMAPGLLAMLARPAELPSGAGAVEFQREQPAADGAARVAVYLSAHRDLDLGGLSLALGWTDSSPAAQATLRFIPAAAGAPALLDDGLPGAIAAAWLGRLQLRAGQRLLLGFVDLPAAGGQVSFPVLHGVKANDRTTGRQVPISVSRSGGTTQ